MPLDHFDGGTNRTFLNRYWVSDANYLGQGLPVFVYDVGEANAEEYAPNILGNGSSFFRRMVDDFGGIGIVWEHRYYGDSSPVNITSETPANEFRYLTMAQALKDVEYFATRFSRPKFPKVDLTPESTPWIFVGASYPGNRAAMLRQYYPHVIFAAYASSAPLQLGEAFGPYYDQIYRGMNAYGFGNCSKDINAAILHIDTLLKNPKTAAAFKRQFLGARVGITVPSNDEFAQNLSGIFEGWRDVGMGHQFRKFCDWIETTDNGTIAGADGWAPSRGAKFVVDQWASFRKEPQNQTDWDEAAATSWRWQTCTEFPIGLATSNNRSMQLVSSFRPKYCEGLEDLGIPEDVANQMYGGWDIRPSNTFWTAGEFDPWTPWTLFSKDPAAPHPKITSKIPKCNVSKKDEIFGRMMRNSEHGFDFGVSPDAAVTRKLFTEALKKWLPCFRPTKRYPKQEHGDSAWEGKSGV
ncbi:peptidase S28 [Phyllosticta citribraziliensis]